jgi:hypothetical protein
LGRFVVPSQEKVTGIGIGAILMTAIPTTAIHGIPTTVIHGIPTAVIHAIHGIPTVVIHAIHGIPTTVILTVLEAVARHGNDRAMPRFKMIGMMTTMIGFNGLKVAG